ncbi:MAG TPA: hypothetical protein VKY37_05190 [Brumimicrobium sp.]|nr:hypothetical protein [Brumimicrobium sp.]
MKTKLHYIAFIFALGFIFFSCKNDYPEEESTEIESTPTQEIIQEVEEPTLVAEEDIETTPVYENPEVQEAHVAIVEKYGQQWDFCKCIIKSDSVNNALMEADDDEFDAVMKRSNFIDNKCKGLLIQPNATPEDRYKHENKVKRCLDSAKR